MFPHPLENKDIATISLGTDPIFTSLRPKPIAHDVNPYGPREAEPCLHSRRNAESYSHGTTNRQCWRASSAPLPGVWLHRLRGEESTAAWNMRTDLDTAPVRVHLIGLMA
ncbi:MAG: hypothetical protein E6X30_01575 [Dermabacter sp.]|uniref:hypothetical protein n=1 Tax=Dermabacter sp. HMSC08H10 TaxID=1581144 RepID=UPI0008A37891|nr:hypothetical protein [Dermabacter sp. HMSC08H10]MDU4922639.1 hypothetical protein [Dermabacter sp.]OFT20819.1 hypothetical protein HMPREF3176_04200 [Dermabacter sp. HMSC08H10]